MNEATDLGQRILNLLADPVLPILLIVVLALVLMRLVHQTVRRVITPIFERQTIEGTTAELGAVEIAKRIETLDTFVTRSIQVFIIVIALVMILGELNYDIGPAIAGLGVVGIAVGFGAQSLVRDLFTGSLILVENQFGKGDVVTIAGVTGVVEDLSLRRTTLRDLSGVVYTVPNGEITVAQNLTRTWARVNENVQVAYGTDMGRAIEVVNEVGRGMLEDPAWEGRVIEAPAVLRVNSLDDSGVTIKITGMVKPSEQWAAAGELRRRLLIAFEDAGIEIPFPHRVVIARSEGAPSPDTTSEASVPAVANDATAPVREGRPAPAEDATGERT
jgi:small-conductance mechanosensitive channel